MKSKIIFTAIIGFFSVVCFGQISPKLQTLVQQSFQNFPKLKEAQQQIRVSEIKTDIARTALKPFVNGNANYTYLTPVANATLPTPDGPRELQFIPHNNLNLNVSVGYNLYDFGRAKQTIQQISGVPIIQQHVLDLTKHNLAYQIAQLYYSISFLGQSRKVQNDVIKNTAAVIGQLENRVKNGDALEFDVLSQKVRLESGRNKLDDFETQIEKQKVLLSYLTGLPTDQIQVEETVFETTNTSPNNLIDKAEDNNIELKLGQDRIRSAQGDVGIAKLGHLPTIVANGSAGFKNGYIPDINLLRFNIAAGVGVTIPIYAGKRFDLQRQVAQVSLEATKYDFEATKATIRKDIETLLADIKGTERKLKNLDAQFIQADRAMAIAKNRLENGVITTVELDNTQTALEEVQLAKINYQYQLFMSQLELKRLVGDVFWK
jgi:outer membrane protein